LFPTSETSFFVKQFYGEATFHRDTGGRVDYLDFEMRVPNSESVAHRIYKIEQDLPVNPE